MRRVLDGKPSDHDPFVCDFRFGVVPGGFRAVTYNGEKKAASQIGGVFADIGHYGADVWLLQEIKRSRKPWRRLSNPDPVKALRKRGLRVTYAKPEFAVGLDPQKWQLIRSYRPLMSPTKYWTINYALVAVARHVDTGLVGKFIDVHPPAHIQAPRNPSFRVVSRVAREWKVTLDRLARRNFDRSVKRAGGIDFVLSGGDENFTLRGGPVNLSHLTDGPLEIVDPPKGTRGSRKIDRFRQRGLEVSR